MSKKKLANYIKEQIEEYLKKGGKIKKLPAGKAKGVDDKTDAKPKNLPRDRQGRTIRFDADERARETINWKDGGTPKKKKKKLSRKEEIERGIPNKEMMKRQFEYDKREQETLGPKKKKKAPTPRVKPAPKSIDIKDKVENIKQRRKPGFKNKKYKHNQKDRNAPEGINIKEGGLVLKVTKKGPLYKGKKSGNKKT